MGTMRPDPKRAIAYLRVSTDEQTLGPDAQRAAIAAWALREGIAIVAWFDDLGVSGGDDLEECPGLLAALDALAEHRAGVLVVAKRDRLARDVMKAGMIEALCERKRATVASAAGEGNGGDPVQVLMRRIVDAFAEYERLLIRARTKAALGVKRARGEKTGGRAPYGYRSDGGETPRLVPVPDEQTVIATIRELRASGLAIHAICRELDARGIKPRTGARFHERTIVRVLRERDASATVSP